MPFYRKRVIHPVWYIWLPIFASFQAGPAAIQELVAALTDDSDTIPWQAGAALHTIGGPQVVGVLQAFIAHSDDATARQAARDVLEKLAI
jgi:HEAT repeat protein